MRAAAILGPKADLRDVRPFEIAGSEIATAERIGAAAGADAALIFGGDGTVHHQLAAAVAAHLPILPVPRGSGNDFAAALGIRSAADALAAWKRFCVDRNVWSVDLGVIAGAAGDRRLATGDYFCCVAGCGLDSEANRRANAMPAWVRARGGYVVGVLGALWRYRAQTVRVAAVDGAGAPRVVEEPATMVAFANAPSYGRGMRIAPRARLDDGLLDVCFVRQVSRLRLLRFFPRVYSGAHLGMREVEYVQTPRLTIETEPALDVYADGEFICLTPVEVTVAPNALQVIVPAESAQSA